METDAVVLQHWQDELDAELQRATLSPLGWPDGTPLRPVREVLADRRALDALAGRKPRLICSERQAA